MKTCFRTTTSRPSRGRPQSAVTAVILSAILLLVPASRAAAVLIDRIVASVNGEIITLYDLYKAEKPAFGEVLLPDQAQIRSQEDIAKERLLLDRIIEERLLHQRAKIMGLTVSPQELDGAIGRIMSEENLTQEMFERALDQRGMTMEAYRERIASQLLVTKVFNNEVRMKIVVSPEEIESFYQENEDEYNIAERATMRHILILKEGRSADEAAEAVSSTMALLEQGKDFQEVARQYSEDSSTYKGDVSGYIHRGDTLPELEEVIFSLQEGEVSSPVESDLGYHIIRVEARDSARMVPLDEVREAIHNKILERKLKDRYRAWLTEIKNEAAIEIRL